MSKKVLVVLGAVALIIAILALSWIATAFIYWLITLCFGIEWDILHATGWWLILGLISSCFNGVKMQLKN